MASNPRPSTAAKAAPLAKRRSRWRRVLRTGAVAAVFALTFLAFAEWRVARAATGRMFASTDAVPPAEVALVLGTGKTFHGRANFFYEARLDAAAALFRAGKVRGVIVSGDNSRRDYSEPDDMKADLVARGVPAAYVTCDYAGFRTLDSVQRVRRVFGQTSVIIVSQRFHLERALYLAGADGLGATGFVAAEAPLRWWLRARSREVLARGAAVLDVALGRGPKFLGPPAAVPLASMLPPPVGPKTTR